MVCSFRLIKLNRGLIMLGYGRGYQPCPECGEPMSEDDCIEGVCVNCHEYDEDECELS